MNALDISLTPIAHFRSPLTSKFGIPRQSGVAKELRGEIILEKEFRTPDAIRGMEDFDFLWLIWGFSANRHKAQGVTVRPPRLGGNKHLGVFATRSPYRPNPIGLSSVRIVDIITEGKDAPVIVVSGADLMDGTPIYDIKPYIPYADSHPDARGGFTDTKEWHTLKVVIPEQLRTMLSEEEQKSLQEILSQDPRPQYHDDPTRIYGFPFAGIEIKFRVENDTCIVEPPLPSPSPAPSNSPRGENRKIVR